MLGETAPSPDVSYPATSPYAPVPYRVLSRKVETADTTTLTLAPADGRPIPHALPGQFNMLYAFGVGEAAISVSGDPAQTGSLVHTVRGVGKVSSALSKLAPGDVAGVRGPYGVGWPLDRMRGKDVVIMAGGLGLAPLRPVIYEILANRASYGRVEIIYGARTPPDILYYPELQAWRTRPDSRFQVTVDSADRSWYGDVGVVTQRIPDARFDPSKTVALVCGPEIMMRLSAQALEGRGVPPSDIWLSLERNMKCAFAQCGHCQYGPLFLCRDGPVLPFSRIQPLMAVREV
jgi:NAD(P)H-flavin reductase